MPGVRLFTNSSKLVGGRAGRRTNERTNGICSVVHGCGMGWSVWSEVMDRQGKARQGKASKLAARTHAVTHSLAASLANKKRVQRAIRRPTIRAAQSQRVGWSAFLLSPKICNQPSHPSGPPPPSSIPSLALRLITAFLLLPPYFFPQPSPPCLSEIPIPSLPRSQPHPKWLSPSRTSGLKSPWPRKLQHSQSPSPRPRRPVPLATGAVPGLPASPVNTTNNVQKERKKTRR